MNSILLLIFYTIGRVGFCAIHHTNLKLVAYETISSIIFLSAAIAWYSILGTFYDGIAMAILFIGTALISRYLATPKQGQWIGIIDFVWLAILGITCGGILLAHNFDVLQVGHFKTGMKPEFYAQLAAEINFLLGKSIDLVIILGTVLAVSMSIIWSGEVWRKKDEEEKTNYKATTRASISMAFAYLLVLISVGFWISLPLYQNYSAVKDFLQ